MKQRFLNILVVTLLMLLFTIGCSFFEQSGATKLDNCKEGVRAMQMFFLVNGCYTPDPNNPEVYIVNTSLICTLYLVGSVKGFDDCEKKYNSGLLD